MIELKAAGLECAMEHSIAVHYDGPVVGAFCADLLVNDALVVELKAVLALAKVHEVQLVNYLTATGIADGLLLNFGASSLEFRRKYRLREPEEISF